MFLNQKISLLTTYHDTVIPQWLDKTIKTQIKEVILIGAYGQVGIAVMRLCLKIGIPIKAITSTKVNFNHKLLKTFTKDQIPSYLRKKNITIIYTGPIHLIKNYENIFPQISHLICFSSTSIFTKDNIDSAESKKIVTDLKEGEKFILDAAKKYNFTVNILRPTMIYGYEMDHNISLLRKYIKLYRFFPIYKNGKGLRQPVHNEDLAASVLSLISLQKRQTKDYNLPGGETISYREMIRRIFLSQELIPVILNIFFLPLLIKIAKLFTKNYLLNADIALNMEKDFVFSYTEAKKDFNYSPRKFILDSI